MKKKQKLLDRRLLGICRSDKAKTTKFWAFKKRLTVTKRKHIFDLFGKLQFRFTKGKIYSEYEDIKHVVPYSVIAIDENSVVIMWHEKKGDSLQHIHFEDDSFYIISGYNVEFFKRERLTQRSTGRAKTARR
ncbi:MAG: hypothetical protein WB402_03940 [Sulfuricaulis sp.]|uniref:hypothetical protein n=1 Tax=Sulfuricaulis sp. TaxID=2003553 RepID=UPI003C662F14